MKTAISNPFLQKNETIANFPVQWGSSYLIFLSYDFVIVTKYTVLI